MGKKMKLQRALSSARRTIVGNIMQPYRRNAEIRKMQHELIEEYKLDSLSIGQEPKRRIRIFPPPKPGDK